MAVTRFTASSATAGAAAPPTAAAQLVGSPADRSWRSWPAASRCQHARGFRRRPPRGWHRQCGAVHGAPPPHTAPATDHCLALRSLPAGAAQPRGRAATAARVPTHPVFQSQPLVLGLMGARPPQRGQDQGASGRCRILHGQPRHLGFLCRRVSCRDAG